MARPRKPRRSCCRAKCTCMMPKGARPKMNEGICITLYKDERTALRFHDVNGLEQKEAAKKMGISQPTFARILKSARRKTSQAVVEGKKLIIE